MNSADTLRPTKHARILTAFFGICVSVWHLGFLQAGTTAADEARWIWAPIQRPTDRPAGPCFFRRTFNLRGADSGRIEITCDHQYVLYVNGVKIGGGKNWKNLDRYDISAYLINGRNVVAVEALKSEPGPAGMVAFVQIKDQRGGTTEFSTDSTWRAHVRRQPGWQQSAFNDMRWFAARSLGNFGTAKPWIASSRVAPEKKRARFEVMREFRVEWVMKSKDTGSLVALSFDEFGNILAAKENGPLLLIRDTDDNGLADKLTTYSDKVKNCQGILAVNGEVFTTADGPEGAALYRLTDDDRDGTADTIKTVLKFEGKMGEHGPHALRLGPDGLVYIMCGNMTQLDAEISSKSPHKFIYEGDLVQPRLEDPRGHARGVKAPGGTIIRTDTNGSFVERFAGGLRNAYDFAFSREGELFTWDSDMEWDQGMTWYRPTRINHIPPGGEFGWRSGWAKWPDHYIDSLPAILATGLGSPTGVVIYDHYMFPQRFHDVMFAGDWTQGQILAIKLKRNGATYSADAAVFVEGNPLNITDLEVGPDGWLYFCTGGRGTEGGIYRVAWTGSVPPEVRDRGEGIEVALRQAQIHTAWARQRIALTKQKLGKQWDTQLPKIATDRSATSRRRTRAMALMHLYGPSPDADMLLALSRDRDQAVRGKAAFLLGIHTDARGKDRLSAMLDDPDTWIQRLACEALVRGQYDLPIEKLIVLLGNSDRFLAWASAKALQTVPADQWQAQVLRSKYQRITLVGSAALLSADPDKPRCLAVLRRMQQIMKGFVSDANFVDLLRVCQLALDRGDVTAEEIPGLVAQLSAEFPAGNKIINRELVRILAYLKADGVADRYLAYFNTKLADIDKTHLAVHAPHFVGGWSTTQRFELLEYFAQARETSGSPNHAQYIDRVARDFVNRMNDDERLAVLQQAEKWPHAALGAIEKLPEKPDKDLLEQLMSLDQKLVSRKDDASEKLRIGVAAALARSREKPAMAYLRKLYDREPERRALLALGLAQSADLDNWPYLVRAIPNLEGNALLDVMSKLAELDLAPQTPEPIRQVILHGLKQEHDGARKTTIKLLEKWTGERMTPDNDPPVNVVAAWQKWFAKEYPNEPPAQLPIPAEDDRYTMEQLQQYLAGDHGQEGDAKRGAIAFEKGQCNKCHRYGSEGEGIGPDLSTISRRFQQREILEAILYPSHVISDQYATKTLETKKGRIYSGVIFRDRETQNLVVLDSTGKQTKIPSNDVEVIEPSNISSMPIGLLNELELEEIADLLAYLRKTPEDRITKRPQR